MKLTTKFSKDELVNIIRQDTNLVPSKKELLECLLNIDSNFLHFSFGLRLSIDSIADWDYIYSEMKSYFIPALLNSNWNFSWGRTWLEEELFIVHIELDQTEKINDYLFKGKYEKDHREEFNLLEIYLTRNDVNNAFEEGIIKDEKKNKWLIETLQDSCSDK
ncbi:hypothetical protein M3175_21020 [Robertmurraya korlensis]|uniref:hypothetical protein n=1 Tax=Robertmurraya korlensis TaxID=519977 RepID=UPI00204181EB|nr:hypothetical protein [Robertmurraya korlensis]MCM3603224.1 hypothetical protein [Robertmurraya korlensis]